MTTTQKRTAFTRWFNRQKFRNFTAQEFTSYFEIFRRGVRNEYPLKEMYGEIIHALRIVDDLRDYFGKPCVILSSYRSKAYNKKCGGVKFSRHLHFDALDIAIAGVSPRDAYNVLLSWRRAGRFTGGLGLYNTFVHIDTRGYNATWGG